MQEEIENKTVAFVISTSTLTAQVLKSVIVKYIAYQKQKNHEKQVVGKIRPTGKQTVKQLVGQNQGVSNIEISDGNIRSFEHVARKYGVDYAVNKDISGEKPKYLVFFKARDADALTSAFSEYTAKNVRHKDKPSVLAMLRKLKEQIAKIDPAKVRKKEMER